MAQLFKGKSRDLGGFFVTRVLPSDAKKMVGPFVFLDHMGPASFDSGDGIDVRPHPHIGMAAITYMLEGSLLHRDSLGNTIEIVPGDVNWMVAGKGITHSERETIEEKARPHRLNGLQCWVALPKDLAETEPDFVHVERDELPHRFYKGVQIRLIAGQAYGMSSPIKTFSPMFYLDVVAAKGGKIDRPNPDQECLVFVHNGNLEIGGNSYKTGDFVLLDDESTLTAKSNSRCLMLGGEKWQDIPLLYWNFVSFDAARIEKAKDDWENQRFAKIPGDDLEFTPLPD